MAVRIRLTRIGKRNSPFYRIGAYDSKTQRDGKCIENLGSYDPLRDGKGTLLKEERIKYWLSVGALPTETVSDLLKRHNISSGN